ncbi:hypothetical protein HC864_05540 [Candidatus Gracilibacteria bacterium]|nr:hypothetical protein [Candidatus Gracilibacteria bacterium]
MVILPNLYMGFGEGAHKYGEELGFSNEPDLYGAVERIELVDLKSLKNPGKIFRRAVGLVSQEVSASISQ